MGNELALVKKDVVDVVTNKVREFQENGELFFPPNYSPENAMKSAWLILQSTVDRDKKPVLSVCTKDSIANSLLDMVVQGLNPAKKQCYFIAYGKELVCQRSYFGSMSVVKSTCRAEDVYAQVVYKGDEFEYEIKRGRKYILKHVQKLENVDKDNIIAAYAIIEFGDGRPEYTEIMTLDQIKKAWLKSKVSPLDDKNAIKPGSTHGQYTDEMCKKTVINRACKSYINSSDDSNLLIKRHFNRTDEERAERNVAEEVANNANKDVIDVEYTEVNQGTGEVTPPCEEQPEDTGGQQGLKATGTEGPGF